MSAKIGPPPAAPVVRPPQPRLQPPLPAGAARPAGALRRSTATGESAGHKAASAGGASQRIEEDDVGNGILAVAAPRDDGGSEGDGQDDTNERSAQARLQALDVRVRHIGDTVAMVCRVEQAQSVWSARIPLHPALLPDTVLHLAYSPSLLALRFQTSDWEARELLQSELETLEALVAQLLPASCSVVITL